MINGNACFAYFNKNWGIPYGRCPLDTPRLCWHIAFDTRGAFGLNKRASTHQAQLT
jgi:hypothetical protein